MRCHIQTNNVMQTLENKAFIDTRLRPGIATALATHRHATHYGQT